MPHRGNRPALLAALALVLGSLALGPPAEACSVSCQNLNLPGLSLADLVAGDSFESDNHDLLFSGFEADTSGTARSDLDCYRVIPLEDGFRILMLMKAFHGSEAELELSYDVEGLKGATIHAASLSFWGAAFGGGSEAGVDMPLPDLVNATPEDLAVFVGGDPYDEQTSHEAQFATAVSLLGIDNELIYAYSSNGDPIHEHGSGCTHHHRHTFGFAAVVRADHHFTTAPEPTTLALMASGLVGLGTLGRRRRRSARRCRSRPLPLGALL